jgi:nitroimidazol reductase NimA-like FMN-containing flavoprotein (pyridoxamine 5'-phosphate oxidase superfamily)
VSEFRWSSVVVLGRYEELSDTPEYKEARRRAQAQLGRRALWSRTAHASNQVRSGHERANTLFYCIHIDRISGRRATEDPVEWGKQLE